MTNKLPDSSREYSIPFKGGLEKIIRWKKNMLLIDLNIHIYFTYQKRIWCVLRKYTLRLTAWEKYTPWTIFIYTFWNSVKQKYDRVLYLYMIISSD